MKNLMIFAFLVVGFGCGTEDAKETVQPPKLADYDQTCQINSDCQVVDTEPCGCGTCTTAVNISDFEAFRAATAKVECTNVGEDCEPCETVPSCFEGVCEGRQTQDIRVEDFSTSCETVADCLLVAEGEVCQPCACPDIAVNKADYELNIGTPQCGYEGVVCNNCLHRELLCVDKVCVAIDPPDI